MILGVGTDIVKVSRIQSSLDRYGERFARRILTAAELSAFLAENRQAHFLAKRFAAKEAVVKALGCGFHLVAPRQVYVYQTIGGSWGRGYTFSVRLSRQALVRTRTGVDRSLWVRSFPRVKMWLSIALLSWQSR